jgi:hypothetical protein
MKYSIRRFENFHILLWLIKDLCWVILWKPLGIFMIAPTLLFAIYITYLNRADKAELAHNIAVCFWISANSIWMIGEFYYEDSTRSIAVIFFLLGLLMILGYYLPLVYKRGIVMVKKKNP